MTLDLSWMHLLRNSAPMMTHAYRYAAHGFPVFPLLGKFPPSGLSGGFHRATTDKDQIRKWWAMWPEANIGWPLPVGMFAVDEDPRHGGDFARTMLEKARGPLPFTMRQTTGGGGYHWIFRAPADVEIHQRSGWFDGIDTRAASKGYLLVEPSVHPETRRPYRWHSIVEPLQAPDWLLDVVRVRKVERKAYTPSPAEGCHPLILDRRRRYALAVLEGEARAVAEAGEGTRNDRLNRAWWRILQFRDVVSESDARRELERAASSAGLGEREISKVLR